MTVKRIFIYMCVMAVAMAEALSQNYNPYAFLRTNASTRSAALAGATVSIAEDPGMVFVNPALVPTFKDRQMSVTLLKHIADINSGNVVFAKEVENVGTFAASAAFISYGSFQARDRDNNQMGNFSPMDIAVAASYGNSLDSNLYYGVSMKFIYSSIYKSSTSAMAFDAGLFYAMPDISTNIGISVLNAGFQLSKINDFSEGLPLDVRIGINHKLKGLPLLANFSFHHLADKVDSFVDRFMNFSLGGEFYFGENVMARIGYDNYIRKYSAPESSKGIAGLSFGAGLVFGNFKVDYAFSRVGLGANLHRLGLNFGI